MVFIQLAIAQEVVQVSSFGRVDEDTLFMEFSPGGVGFKVVSSETLQFGAATDIRPTIEPLRNGQNRFEFNVDPELPKNFFRLERLAEPTVSIQSITALGDSITSGARVNAPDAVAGGYMGACLNLIKHRLTPVFAQPEGSWYQTGGFTSQQIIDTWLPRIITDRPDVCVVFAGANSLDDARGFSSDLDLAAQWLYGQNSQIVNELVSAGIIPIYCTMTPDSFPTDAVYPPASGYYHPDYRSIRKKVNDLARADIVSRGAILCDWSSVLSTSPGDDTALANTDWLADNIHPNGQGQIKLAAFLKKTIEVNFITPEDFVIPAEGDASWLLENPYLAGDVGGLATGWNLYGNATAKLASKSGLNTQRIAVQSAFGALKSASLTRYMQVTDQSLDGKTIRPICRLKMPNPSKLPVWVELFVRSMDLDDAGGRKESYVQRLWGSGNGNAMTVTLDQNDMLMLGPPIKTITTTGTDRHRITIVVNVYGGDEECEVDLETVGVLQVTD